MDIKNVILHCKLAYKIGASIAAVYYMFKKNHREGDYEKGWMWLAISVAIDV